VAGLAVALELVEVARPPGGLEAIVAANVLHRAVAFGPTRADAQLRGARARLLVGGEVREEGPIRGGPERTLCAVAGLIAAVGERREPGHRPVCMRRRDSGIAGSWDVACGRPRCTPGRAGACSSP